MRIALEHRSEAALQENLEINLGRACNNRCVFCSNGAVPPNARGWMKLKAVQDEILGASRRGVTAIGFIGGEPTLYPNLAKVVAFARQSGFKRVALCTNGSRLADPDLLSRLLQAGITRVALSIHSHRAKIEDAITRRPGSFVEKLAAIHLLIKAAGKGQLPDGFSLNIVLHRGNLRHLESMVRFFQGMGVPDLRFNFIRPENQATGSKHWVPSFTETTPHLQSLILANESRLGALLNFADIPPCKLPWQVLANPSLREKYIGENLDLATHVTLFRPDSVGGTKRFSWQDQRTRYLKDHPPTCEPCLLRGICEGVWRGYLDIYGTKEFDGCAVQVEACLSTSLR